MEAEWNQTLATYRTQYPSADAAAEFERMLRGELLKDGTRICPATPPTTRVWPHEHSQICLGALGPNLPELIGGSADLTHSNYTDIKGETGSYQPGNPWRSVIHTSVCGAPWPPCSTASLTTTAA